MSGESVRKRRDEICGTHGWTVRIGTRDARAFLSDSVGHAAFDEIDAVGVCWIHGGGVGVCVWVWVYRAIERGTEGGLSSGITTPRPIPFYCVGGGKGAAVGQLTSKRAYRRRSVAVVVPRALSANEGIGGKETDFRISPRGRATTKL